MSLMADRPVNAEERLKRVLNPTARRPDAATLTKQQDLFQAKVAKAANKLGQSFRPNNEAELGKIRLELLNAGFRGDQAVPVYYGLKLGALILTALIVAPIAVSRSGFTSGAITPIVIAGGFAFYILGVIS